MLIISICQFYAITKNPTKDSEKSNNFGDYRCDEYVTDLEGLSKMLKKKGVAIIKNILTEKECEDMYSCAWDFLEHITSEWEVPISRNNIESWRQFPKLFALHSMLIQHHGVGHAQWLWDLRQNPKVIEVLSCLWKVDPTELLVSFDGASIHLPPEKTNRGWKGKSWLHTDQSYTRNDFECIQSWVTALDVNEGDATLMFLEGSHLHHKTIGEKFNITDKSDWFKLGDQHVKAYTDLGCELRRVRCPAGSMVLWDSRTIHCGQEAMKGRKKIKYKMCRICVYATQIFSHGCHD